MSRRHSQLYTPQFMRSHTSFSSFSEMLDRGRFGARSSDSPATVDAERWDDYVRRVTHFASWEDMRHHALRERVSCRLFPARDNVVSLASARHGDDA